MVNIVLLLKEELLPFFNDGKYKTPRDITKLIHPDINITSSRTPELVYISKIIAKLYRGRLLERRLIDATKGFASFEYRKK